jgi:hypothetical protein
MFNNFYPNTASFEITPNNVMETAGPQMTSQHGAHALHAGLAKLHPLMRMHTSKRPGTHMCARVHTQTKK